ncbi:hypothetical protein C1645_838546 [Glomus cerebriforme]|uniref:C2H2-type domain-containing protein n=1 Tax=Glomus cerebriforme TaxID=658196 RepID=A0A397S293_9GLOM|nr:hypothetical protein C1645_838546 [Glomus cerebriforme]
MSIGRLFPMSSDRTNAMSKIFQCQICGETFHSKSSISRHEHQLHPNNRIVPHGFLLGIASQEDDNTKSEETSETERMKTHLLPINEHEYWIKKLEGQDSVMLNMIIEAL